MQIKLKPNVFLKLEAVRVAVGSLEFSGFGFVNILKTETETIFEVYDVVLLDVGSSVFTEIPAEKILPLMDRPDAKNMKVWFHRHPCGNAVPGPHNWSGTDNKTATETPLGGVPEMVKWAISIVRTPQTWVGRIDRFNGQVQTVHLPVVFNEDQSFVDQSVVLKTAYEQRLAKEQAALAMLPPAKETSAYARPFGGIRLMVIRILDRVSRIVSNLHVRMILSTFRGERDDQI